MARKYSPEPQWFTLPDVDPSVQDPSLKPWIDYAREHQYTEIPRDLRLPGRPRLSERQFNLLNTYLQASGGGWVQSSDTRRIMNEAMNKEAQAWRSASDERRKRVDEWYKQPGQGRAVLKYLRDLGIYIWEEIIEGAPPQKSSIGKKK